MISLKPQKGHLLVAEPSIIGDVSFNRAVVLLADHNQKGSIGFILNKPLKFTLNELISGVNKPFKVFNGGPVEQDNLYFIHKRPDLIDNSIEISNGIFWGGNFDTVLKLINNNKLDPEDIRFFLGYSGWEKDQLENEMESNSWVVSENIYENNLISQCCQNIWKDKMLELGGEYSIWSNAPEHPSYN